MAIAYLDTQSGIAGDMLLAALVDAGADADYIKSQLKTIGLPGEVELEFSHTHRHDFRGSETGCAFSYGACSSPPARYRRHDSP